jgi:hypothetical protein
MDTSTLASQISAATAAGADGLDEAQRIELLTACTKLKDALTNPFEQVIGLMWSVSIPITSMSLLLTLPGFRWNRPQTGYRSRTTRHHARKHRLNNDTR